MPEPLIPGCPLPDPDVIRARISDLKCPRSIEFEADLPRTPTGKLLKRQLRDRYWPASR